MRKHTLITLAAVVATMLLTTALQPLALLQAVAQQAVACRTFGETGRVVCGRFLEYWQQHGGLPVFGYPISNEFREQSKLNNQVYTVQYFERAVFELHPENKPPYDVLLSQLGTFQFSSEYPVGSAVGSYPIYPNHRNFRVEHDGNETKISFSTEAGKEQVLKFYREALLRAGWELIEARQDNSHFAHVSPTAAFIRSQNCPGAVTQPYEQEVFTTFVDVTTLTDGKTNVKIAIIQQLLIDLPPEPKPESSKLDDLSLYSQSSARGKQLKDGRKRTGESGKSDNRSKHD